MGIFGDRGFIGSGGIFGGTGSSDRGGFSGVFDDTIGELSGMNDAADAAQRAAEARERNLGLAVGMGEEGLARTQQGRAGLRTRENRAIRDARGNLGAAQGNQTQNRQDISQAIANANSPQELAALESALSNQERFLQRQEQVLANIDPAIMEASQQMLSVLQGGEAQFLDPVRQEREAQKQELIDSLREQMGPGAETSTAGTQALNDFDRQTNLMISQQREQTLNQLFNISNQGVQTSVNAQNAGIAGLGGIAQGFGNRAGRLTQAGLGGVGANMQSQAMTQQAGQNLVGTRLGGMEAFLGGLQIERGSNADRMNAQGGLAAGAGSQFVGNQLRGQAQNQFFNDRLQSMEQSSAMLAGQAMGGMSSGGGAASGGGGAGAAAMCCFIFLEARYGTGAMDEVVRRFRDENMTPRNQRGYYKLSEVLVPLMRKYPLIKWLTRIFMTDPLVAYGKYHYGQNRWGRIMKPIKNFWLKTFDYLGQDHEFVRENGEVV